MRAIALLLLVGCGRVGFESHVDGHTVDAPPCPGGIVRGAPHVIPTGTEARDLVAGDLDRDGNLDIVVANGFDSNVSVVLGRGDGTFAPSVIYAVGNHPFSLDTGDVDNDGDLDLAVGNNQDNTVSILLGAGDGTFAPQLVADLNGAVPPQSTKLADIDNDGRLDLLTAAYMNNLVTFGLGNGDGTFAPANVFATGTGPYSIVVGDFDGDGLRDVVSTSTGQSTVRFLHGEGNDQLAIGADYGTSSAIAQPWNVAAADFDGDGNLDLAVANNNFSPSTVAILRGKGSTFQTFQAPLEVPSSDEPWSIAVGDVTGDGVLDLVIADGTFNTYSIYAGHGDATFDARTIQAGVRRPLGIIVGDFNGDQLLDIAMAAADDAALDVSLSSCP